MFFGIYRGRRAFVTGHTGFKGSWLSAWLASLGAEVAGYSVGVPTEPSCFQALGLSARMRDLRGDIRDRERLRGAVSDFAPEIVFHLAAQALVRESYVHPVETFETNMLGTLNVLEIARGIPSVKAVVIITSDKCYRNDEWVYGYRETDYLGGSDPYSASKGCAELIANSYFRSFYGNGPAAATVRAGNVIGGGDWAADRIVPDCARAWAAGRPVAIRNPGATRPWQHVLEPLSGYLWLGARLLDNGIAGASPWHHEGQAYNFGPSADAVHTVLEVCQALARNWPAFSFAAEGPAESAMKECGLLKLCCDKALAELAWKAALDFDETVRYAAEWYARYYAEQNPDDGMWRFTLGQIAAYANAAASRGLLWARE